MSAFQVIFVGVPMVFILESVSTDGRFLGSSLILWTFPMTTVCLIFLPKIIAVHFPSKGDRHESRGSPSGGIRVSGLTSSRANNSGATQSHEPRESRTTRQSDPSSLNQSDVPNLTRPPSRISHVTVQ